jgi:hypothetical protein
LTEAQIAERVGIPLDEWQAAVPALEKSGFPRPESLFKNRRYWPACRAFLDRRYGLGEKVGAGLPALDGEEQWG